MVDEDKVRAWRFHKQGLDGGLAGQPPAKILAQTGWARSMGGAAPYLTLFARGEAGREIVDRAVADLAIHELPAARHCTYVVPGGDFALALAAGRDSSEGEMKVALKLGVTAKEIEKLCAAVLRALEAGPLDTDAIRAAAGPAVRSLGEEGKKKGLTTTLPVALGRLQAAGEIRRVPLNGRLDQQRYRYVLWRPNPLASYGASAEETNLELARRYFTWIGPATAADFQQFSALTAKASKAAVEGLKLVPLEDGDPRLLTREQYEKFQSFRTPKDPQYAMVARLDGIALLRNDASSLLAPEDLDRPLPAEKGTVSGRGLKFLGNQAILDRGRLIGLWEYDVETESIASMLFVKPAAALKAAIERTAKFIREELGDARTGSLDSPKARAGRIEALRKASKGK